MTNTRAPKILVVDDEVGIRELLVEILRDEGYQVTAAADGDSARRAWLETNPDLVLLDIWLPGADGVTLLKEWRAKERSAAVIAMSGHATIDTAVEAVKHGAADVLEKPIAMSRLLAAIKKCLAKASAPRMSPVLESADFGSSPAMMKMKKQLATASMDQAPVLFVAGLADGAPFFAEFLRPPGRPFVVVEDHKRLTGEWEGLLNEVGDGVIFARGLGRMNGAQKESLCALSRSLAKRGARLAGEAPLAPEGQDPLTALFASHVIATPPLENYQSDIPQIINMLTRQLGRNYRSITASFSVEAINMLVNYRFAGGFAELRAIARGALLQTLENKVSADLLRATISQLEWETKAIADEVYALPLRQARDVFEREYLARLIAGARGNMQKAAAQAGLERTSLYRKLKRMNLDTGEEE